MTRSDEGLPAEVIALLLSSRRAESASAWTLLERAHIISQPMAGPHVRVHVAMFARAWREPRWREVLGQVPRVLVAAPASWLGRYPKGNRGTTAVSMFRPEPMPEDLADRLETKSGSRPGHS